MQWYNVERAVQSADAGIDGQVKIDTFFVTMHMNEITQCAT